MNSISLKRIVSFCVPIIAFLFFLGCSGMKDDNYQLIEYPIETNDDISFLSKPDLKILDIGNSYTNDATDHLPSLVKAADLSLDDMCLYKATRGSASFKNWMDVYNGKDKGSTYSVSKVVGGLKTTIPTGKDTGDNGELFRRVLTEEKWDLIIIHQASGFATDYDKWFTQWDGGYLDEFLGILKKHQPDAKIGFLLIHSYWDNYSGNREGSSIIRWHKIATGVRNLKNDHRIDFVVPYGTAVENLRSSSLYDSHDLTRDGTHCGIGLCRYTAACCYYETIIAPRTGVSILGNSARTSHSSSSDYKYDPIDVTDDNAYIAQKAAVLAIGNMFNCVNPETGEKVIK